MNIFAWIKPNIFTEKKYRNVKINIFIKMAATPGAQYSFPIKRMSKAAGKTKVGPVVIAGSNKTSLLSGDSKETLYPNPFAKFFAAVEI